jgi:hypothetical protein
MVKFVNKNESFYGYNQKKHIFERIDRRQYRIFFL